MSQVCWTNAHHRSFAALRACPRAKRRDDSEGFCHPERSEGSLADVLVITRQKYALLSPLAFWRYLNSHMMYNKLDNTPNKKANR